MNINGWNIQINDSFANMIDDIYLKEDVTPLKENLFKVFELVKFEDVNVVILGQDPYPTKGDANGIAFSVNRKESLPPSLRNIYKELKEDLNIDRVDGDLSDIVKQGVLLMNVVLTTQVSKPRYHHTLGWQEITTKIIADLSDKHNIIFVLLGGDAQGYKKYIDCESNIIIETSHPSPLSAYRGFNGSKIFTKINEDLIKQGKKSIIWK